MKHNFLYVILFAITSGFSQDIQFTSKEITINQYIDGTLLLPENQEKLPLAIIIPGSGPTDRNGNQNFLKNNSLKKLAEALSAKNIATFRYDKRVVKQIKQGNVDPNIKFDDFVTDAISVINYFKTRSNFAKIIVIGHSQGSLVGMLASKDNAEAFISLAGAGKPIDEVITNQITMSAPFLVDDTKRVFSILKKGETTNDFPPALASIFNLGVQPFIMNWMSYNPQEVIKTLNIPILIINGTKDLQVLPTEAELLKKAKPDAQINIITNMNHILFDIEGDTLENSKSYNESFRPINTELITIIASFINSL